MTPKQMKYMALIGLMVVVLFLATFMSMGVTEGLTEQQKCNTPNFWDKQNKKCVAVCPAGTKKKPNNGGFGCFPMKCPDPNNPTWDNLTNKCVATCPPGTTKKSSSNGSNCNKNKCSVEPDLFWDTTQHKCVAACPPGFLSNTRGICNLKPATVGQTTPAQTTPTIVKETTTVTPVTPTQESPV